MGSFGVLDLGLFGGRIDKCWDFSGCGVFCGGVFGGGKFIVEVGGGGLEVAQRVDFGGVLGVVGRG